MSVAENKALIRRFYEEIDKGNLAAIAELVAEDYVDHSPPPFPGAHTSGRATEAAANVIRNANAYRDQPRPGDFEIETRRAYDRIEIAIRDAGCGPIPNPDSEGIPLMSALADTLIIEGQPGEGTTVRMTFHTDPKSARDQSTRPAREYLDSHSPEGAHRA